VAHFPPRPSIERCDLRLAPRRQGAAVAEVLYFRHVEVDNTPLRNENAGGTNRGNPELNEDQHKEAPIGGLAGRERGSRNVLILPVSRLR
jgi:hypothetical protein